MKSLFPPLSAETRLLLNRLGFLADKVFPIPGRFRPALPKDIAELSRLLTSARGERGASYLGKPALLSAYLRYFMPWNIYRLCRLLSGLTLDLKPGDAVNDLGAGPLTLACSLWISQPDLRSQPLEFRCIDKTPSVLEAGRKIFTALTSAALSSAPETAKTCPWTIKTIKGEIKKNGSLSVEIRGKPAALTAALNVYNELFWDFSPADSEGLEKFSEKQARLLSSLTDKAGHILVVEPGIPRSGEFISVLRTSLLNNDRYPLSPCTHSYLCPFPGGQDKNKNKWCHFSFDTEDAPENLHRLSAAAGIPKERAVLSFLLSGVSPDISAGKKSKSEIRIISDPFPLGGGNPNEEGSWGRYGCSEQGLVLISGSRRKIEAAASGALEALKLTPGKIDSKSGALIVNV